MRYRLLVRNRVPIGEPMLYDARVWARPSSTDARANDSQALHVVLDLVDSESDVSISRHVG